MVSNSSRSNELFNEFVSSQSQPSADLYSEFTQNQRQPAIPETDMARLIGEYGVKGALGMLDAAKMLINPSLPYAPEEVQQQMGESFQQLPGPTDIARSGLQNLGMSIDTQQPQTPTQRIIAEGASGIGANIIPALGSLSKLAKLGSLGFAVGATSGAAKEAGAPPLAADIGASLGVPAGLYGASKVAQKGTKLAQSFKRGMEPPLLSPEHELHATASKSKIKEAEQRVSNVLRQEIGEKDFPNVMRKLESYQRGPYALSTPDVTENMRLAQIQKSTLGTKEGSATQRRHLENIEKMKQDIEELAPTQYGIEATREHIRDVGKNLQSAQDRAFGAGEKKLQESLESIKRTKESEEAGKSIRGHLAGKIKATRKRATKEADPHYKAAFKGEESINPILTQRYLDAEKKTANKDTLKFLKNIEDDISSSIPFSAKSDLLKKKQSIYNAVGKDLNKANQIINEQFPEINQLYPSAEKLENARRAIKYTLEDMQPNERNKKRILIEVLKKMDLDIDKSSSAPHLKEAKKVYRELLSPINVAEESPLFKKVLKKNRGYRKDYTIADSEVPKKFLSKSASKEDSQALLSFIRDNKDAKENIKGFINKDLLENILDGDRVNLKKLESWKKSNPNALIFYPELSSRIKNINNAQSYINAIVKQNEKVMKTFFEESASEALNANVNQIVPSILSGRDSANKMKNLMKYVNTDETGAAKEGLRGAVTKDMLGPTNHLTPAATVKYVEKNNQALKELFDDNQMQVLEEASKYMKAHLKTQRLAAVPGSPTWQNVANNRSILDGLMAFGPRKLMKVLKVDSYPFVNKYLANIEKKHLKEQELYKLLLDEAMADSEYARILLKTPQEIEKSPDLIKKLNARIMRSLMTVSSMPEGEEKEQE